MPEKDKAGTGKSIFRFATLFYQVIAAASIIIGAIWFIAGWHSRVNTRLDGIDHHLTRIDTSLERIIQDLGSKQICQGRPLSVAMPQRQSDQGSGE